MRYHFTLTEASGDSFIDREDLLSEMLKTLSEPKLRMGYALYGIRRIGKSSILKELESRLKKKKGIVPIYFNVWNLDLSTVPEFVENFTAEALEAYENLIGIKKDRKLSDYPKETIKFILKNVKLKAKILEEVEVLLTYNDEPDPQPKSITRAFEAIDQIAAETKTRAVVLLDEFPNITGLTYEGKKIGPQIIKSIRVTYGQKLENTVLCIAGSTKSTMNETVIDKTSPFYRQLIVREVKPLEKRFVRKIITAGVDWGLTDEAVDRIYKFTKGIPFYVQFIGRQLYMHDRKKTDEEKIREIIDEFLQEEGNIIFLKEFKDLSRKEREVIVILAMGEERKLSAVSKKLMDPLANVHTIARNLADKGVLEKTGKGEYEFTDTIFKKWIKRRYEE